MTLLHCCCTLIPFRIEESLTDETKEFMEREFRFFREVTGISGEIRYRSQGQSEFRSLLVLMP